MKESRGDRVPTSPGGIQVTAHNRRSGWLDSLWSRLSLAEAPALPALLRPIAPRGLEVARWLTLGT
jgi:hypothetical protein